MTAISNTIAQRDIEALIHPYTNMKKHRDQGPVVMVRGKGVRVWDHQGKDYIEGLAGLWCASLGFDEPELVEAARKQMAELPFYHQFNHKSAPPTIALAEKLKAIAPFAADKVFFCNSGSEANDTQIKLVWYYNNALGRTKKKKIVSRIKAYHGVTIATASLTGLPNNHRDFDLPIAGIVHTDCPHHYRFAKDGESEEEFSARLAAQLDAFIQKEGPDTVAAFIAEPVMGAGGAIIPPKGYFQAIQAVLRKYDVLFIADEVITGFGRTGNMWACETFGIKPDLLTCAKALSAAFLPISACLISKPIADAVTENSAKIGVFGHGYTYSGHPVPAAVAVRTLELYEQRKIVEHVRKVSRRFLARIEALRDHPLVGEAKGVGLIGAVELVADKRSKRAFDPKLGVSQYCGAQAERHGVILRGLMGDRVAFCPPLIITEAEIDEMFDRFDRALADTLGYVRGAAAAE
ncbi:MAG: aspartate aminotransferase family protein [Alphaproteobacteria bacterium]|nr:aspartate aminotransferase family protein [Alphaproteobacteria bacterium]